MEDFAVIDFEGAIDGKPISELAPQASKNLQGGKKFWLRVAPDNFLPNFCEQIVGMKRGETRSVQVEFPGGVSSAGIGGQESGLRGDLERDQTEGAAGSWTTPSPRS